MRLRTNVYVDGFNLYYGLLKKVPQRKWLDLEKLSRHLRKGDNINRVRYFTAAVKHTYDSHEPVRQQAYLRALATLPIVSVHQGQFQKNTVSRPRADSPPNDPKFVSIVEFEEKGSDVNLATMLLCDAFDGDFQQAIVISNDSDLALPIEMVRDKMKLKVGVYSPRPTTTFRLVKAASYVGKLRAIHIEECQLPPTLTDARGTIRKPDHW